MTVSVIIPTLNEAAHLHENLKHLKATQGTHELIIVDGGSKDDTVSIAQKHTKQTYGTSASRARQMNLGAKHATGDTLLFLHADSQTSPQLFPAIVEALATQSTLGGCLKRRFCPPLNDRKTSRCLKRLDKMAEKRVRRQGPMLGDQGIFVRRKSFEQLQGFCAEVPYEDIDFSFRLSKMGQVALADSLLYTSIRRFKKRGAACQVSLDWTNVFCHALIHRPTLLIYLLSTLPIGSLDTNKLNSTPPKMT